MNIDFEKFAKYSKPGPRYTSYPTAPEFDDSFDDATYEKELLSQDKKTREVIQLHFGGGTPTFFDAKQLQKIISLIKNKFKNFSKNAEISCEIDPRYLTQAQLDVLIENGFNRISFGVQDFNHKVH